ncbi:hypothetical protein H0H87_004397 [Tephrocybe sp. NHM501043]|nr:hypothetical protein H0H87_004397 [Tephrocybe sp. NHM501043]
MLTLPLLASCVIFGTYATPAKSVLSERFDSVCVEIDNATSSETSVFYPADLLGRYDADISHWASSSSQLSKCSVRPGTAEDLSIILGIVNSSQTPFAIKGGGHASNPGFSSTTGVHISMERFSEVTYDATSQTAVVGAGLVWDDVYAALAPHNVNVVGGRVSNVGVAGFTLGGGYSWLTNQHGLTIDTVVAFELVKPNGDIVLVTETSDSELFFGLKGGLITITAPWIDDVTAATAKFSASITDPKAGIITTYNFLLGQPGISLLLFYDGPTPPSGIFDDFLKIVYLTKDVSTRDFLSLVKSSPSDATYGQRGIFNSVSLTQYTPTILKAILNETVFWGSRLSLISGSFISYDVEPFLPDLFSHGPASAYPPSRSAGLSPFNIYFAWGLELSDDEFHEAARKSAAQIKAVALAEGQDIAELAIYPNYAIYDTPLEKMYGNNVASLRELKASVDPTNVMGFAGGFKF